MIVTTINVNGIRAAVKERSEENLGLLPWLRDTTSDVICLQETRADNAQLAQALEPALDAGWHLASAEPHAKGRNGVAVLSRAPISAVRVGLSPDCEFVGHGRYLEADTDGVTVASVYVPTGEAETDKQVEKERFMVALAARMAELSRKRRDVVICGDWNICATELDLKAWKANVKKSGFLPSERQWLAELLASGWTDVVRALHPDVAGPYSWWSWRGKAFDNDAGWRIDYHMATPALADVARNAVVDRASAWDTRWSDHAPLVIDYKL